MKTSTVIGIIAALGVAGGIVYVATKDSGPGKDPRQVLTSDQFGANDTWSFTIAQPSPTTGIMANIYGPDGAYADEATARIAGMNWLAAHPLV